MTGPDRAYLEARVAEIAAAIGAGDGTYQQVLEAICADGYPEVAQWLAEDLVALALAQRREGL